MELDRALRLLKLNSTCSIDALNESFRKLAKTYHPDSNRGREKWAHKIMTDLNLSYETVLDYLTAVDKKAVGVESKSKPGSFQVQFNRSIHYVLDGIYIYYQYGLENVRLRNEGVRKFRYRDSIRNLRDGIQSLEALKEHTASDSSSIRLQVFTDFSKAFFQNALINRCYFPSDMVSESSAYRHYSTGSDHLDYAIKDAFFGDELIQVRKGSYSDNMKLSRKEFMAVVAEYCDSSWVAEALLKIYLLQMFSRVVEVLQKMRY